MARKRQKITTEVVPVCMDTLGELDNGNCKRIVDQLIRAIMHDLDDRGAEDGKPRSLTIKVKVEFIKVNGRTVVTPVMDYKLPPRVAHSTVTVERADEGGQFQLYFQPWNAENANQPVFNQMTEVDEDSPPPKG
jgi:hypothetical protein